MSTLYTPNEKFSLAEDLLNLYQSASCVITNRLHVALPCLAFNTPVLLLDNYNFDKDRFSGLKELLYTTEIDDYFQNYNIFDVENPPSNKNNYLKIRKNLISKCQRFTGHLNENDRKNPTVLNFICLY
ncbi:polysaccharide pyruvyl transferase family protein [Methanobrevibacter arboriphilus]|uniref:polysaccharide pyruvyl transferase family protein n=1 Tax=Methanobrevibacter arboriphilus TaxID=39441 RepID=UPI0006D1BC28|nr:polysaccharide pyruvyl transferase family protein [Methanobrevibacter arboriphilus]